MATVIKVEEPVMKEEEEEEGQWNGGREGCRETWFSGEK